MNNEFKKKMQLYKEGKLNQDEISKIEDEIDKFLAIMDYINDDDKEFLEDLKQQMPPGNREENKLAKHLKRRVNLRIIMMTVTSVLSTLIIIMILYNSASSILSSLFGLKLNEAFVQREIVVQFAKMFNPQYESRGSGVQRLNFAQQNIHVSLDNTVGNTKINETEISVRYSFGKPVKTGPPTEVPPFVPQDFSLYDNHEYDPVSGFKILERAPQGTRAKVFIEFNKTLTPQQLKENFTSKIGTEDTAPLEITPLTVIASKFVLANPSYYQFRPVFPYEGNNAKQYKGNALKQTQYDNLDNQAHKESFIGNLNLIKNNKRLLHVMYYSDMFDDINIDTVIENAENNGVQYVGMYISADSKELLKLKGNPMIHCLRVQNIVLW